MNNLPTHKIANAIRKDSKVEYQDLRYPDIQEGESLVFVNEDFNGTDFDNFNMGFWGFHGCNLDHSKGYNGQPIVFSDCSVKNADFRGASIVIHAKNSDFTGIKIDALTDIYLSKFENCVFDTETERLVAGWGENHD